MNIKDLKNFFKLDPAVEARLARLRWFRQSSSNSLIIRNNLLLETVGVLVGETKVTSLCPMTMCWIKNWLMISGRLRKQWIHNFANSSNLLSKIGEFLLIISLILAIAYSLDSILFDLKQWRWIFTPYLFNQKIL